MENSEVAIRYSPVTESNGRDEQCLVEQAIKNENDALVEESVVRRVVQEKNLP